MIVLFERRNVFGIQLREPGQEVFFPMLYDIIEYREGLTGNLQYFALYTELR
jgi:hypothetical protein